MAIPNSLGVTFRVTASDVSPAKDLIFGFVQEVTTYFGSFDISKGPSAAPEDFIQENGGCFLVAYVGESPVGAGGVKKLADGMGEIKRMFVVPQFRGKGISRKLLKELELQAKQLGYSKVRLDTGGAEQQAGARALYNSSGYKEIPDYNNNPYAAYWYEKDI